MRTWQMVGSAYMVVSAVTYWRLFRDVAVQRSAGWMFAVAAAVLRSAIALISPLLLAFLFAQQACRRLIARMSPRVRAAEGERFRRS